jgi:hypothetical protein
MLCIRCGAGIAKDFYCIRCGYVPTKGGDVEFKSSNAVVMYLQHQGRNLLSGLTHIFRQVRL